jgi:hypothetical protein
MPNVVGEGILASAEQYFSYLPPIAYDPLMAGLAAGISAYAPGFSTEFPNMESIENFQTGLRVTGTIKSVDIGLQYYYGHLYRPVFTVSGVDDFLGTILSTPDPSKLSPQMKYNRYHQIGLDYAQIILGFNIRAEAAIHLTEDMKGDLGSVRNPFIGWSLGFDRNLFWGLNLNVQCNQTIRLFDDKVGDNPILDAEAGTNKISTRFTAQLSKEQREHLETKVTVIWDIEDFGLYVIPYRSWTFKNMTYVISLGFFFGEDYSELGYYWRNSFLKVGLKYSF